MDHEAYELTASAIDRCPLTVRDNSCTPPINRLITRNNSVLSYFGIEDIPFQHRDAGTGILQVYDIFSRQLIKLNLNNIDTITYFCMPGWISPAAVASDQPNSYEFETFLFQQMEPFLQDVKESLQQNCFEDQKVLSQEEEIQFMVFVQALTNYKLKTRDQKMYNYLFSEFHKRCNRQAFNYVKKYFNYVKLYPVLILCESKDKFKTVEDIVDYVSDSSQVFEAWKNILKDSSLKQIKKYENEFELLCKEKFAGEEFQQERDFLQLQYTKAINDVKNLDFDKTLVIYKNNPFLLLRFWPTEFDILSDLDNIKMLNHYEHIVLQSLFLNGITVGMGDIDFTEIEMYNRSIIDQLNIQYLDHLKIKRMEQIRKHADKIVATVLDEIGDLEQEDLNDIVTSIRDFDSFQERLNSLDNIASVMQYWPSILLPAPDHVRRLGTVSYEVLDMYLTNTADKD